MEFGKIIAETRERVRRHRGWLGRVDSQDHFELGPHPDDPLSEHWNTQATLLKKGKVIWATLVQANAKLYELGVIWYPGEVICSADSHFDTNVEELDKVATIIQSLKHKTPSNPASREIAHDLTGEMARSFGKPVPLELISKVTKSTNIRRDTIVFDRSHLPERVLCCSWIPVLYHRSCRNVMMLPSRLWGQQLLDLWKLSPNAKQELEDDYQRRKESMRSNPLVRVTPSAVEMIREFGRDSGPPPYILRLSIVDGRYDFRFIDSQEIQHDDEREEFDGYQVVMDSRSAEMVWGIEIDFLTRPGKTGFKFNL